MVKIFLQALLKPSTWRCHFIQFLEIISTPKIVLYHIIIDENNFLITGIINFNYLNI